MKKLSILFWAMAVSLMTFAQASLPYEEGFESSFTYGDEVYFINNWWGSKVALDTMYQETNNVHSGTAALAFIPFGEEEYMYAQVHLDLTGKSNVVTNFWIAAESTGGSKSVRLFIDLSIDNGVTWTPSVEIGEHGGFPNENIPYAQYSYAFSPIADNQPDVILRFGVRPGIMQEPAGKIIMDDVEVIANDEDIFKPVVLEPQVIGADSIYLIYSEPVDEVTATNASNYVFTPSLTIGSVALTSSQDTVYIVLATPLESGEPYELVVSNVEDLAGNVMDPAELEVTWSNVTGGLVITEIMYDSPPPEQNDPLEYIEIYNATCEPLSLGGIQLKEAVFSSPLPQYILQPGEYYVMTKNNTQFNQVFGFSANFQWQAGNLDNLGDFLLLLPTDHHANFNLDSVVYSTTDPWPADAAGTGRSLELTNAFLDNAAGANWMASTTEAGTLNSYTIYGSPGAGYDVSLNPVVNLGESGNRCGVTEIVLDAENPGAKYLWSTGEETQTITVTESGTYSVVVNNGVGAAFDEIELDFVPAITAEGVIPANVCQGTEIGFEATSATATSWHWDFGDETISTDQNPNHVYTESGEYTVTLTVYNTYGCSDTYSSNIEVYENEVVWSFAAEACQNEQVAFTNTSASATSWSWDFGDEGVSSDQNPVHTYTEPGEYVVSLTVTNTNGCTSSAAEDIIIHPKDAQITLPQQACENTALNFAATSTEGVTWAWDFGDGTTSDQQNPDHTYTNDGNYAITLNVTNSFGCVATANEELVVNNNEVAWTLPEEPICTYTDIEFMGVGQADNNWQWNFGDGNTSNQQKPMHQFTEPGEHTVTLTVTNQFGCTATAEEVLTVGICVGTEADLPEGEIRVYPNPGNDIVAVNLNWQQAQSGRIWVINTQGVTVLEQPLSRQEGSVHHLNVSQLHSGTYMVRVQTGNQIINKRLIVVK